MNLYFVEPFNEQGNFMGYPDNCFKYLDGVTDKQERELLFLGICRVSHNDEYLVDMDYQGHPYNTPFKKKTTLYIMLYDLVLPVLRQEKINELIN